MTAHDTNILIYACDRSDPHRQRKAIEFLENSSDGVLLWQVACEFVTASRKLKAQGFTTDQAWSRLREFLDLFPLVLPATATLSRAETSLGNTAFCSGTAWFWRLALRPGSKRSIRKTSQD